MRHAAGEPASSSERADESGSTAQSADQQEGGISGTLDTPVLSGTLQPTPTRRTGRRATSHRAPRRRRLIDYPRRGKRGVRRWIPSWKLMSGLVFGFLALLVGAFFVALALVQVPQANDFATSQATIFQYADGRTQIAHIGVNRVSVSLDRIPTTVRYAVLAAEDRSFYTEPAVSPTGILRALRNDVTSGSGSLQGGSTITQQYVKNYYLTERQTISRKLDEALVAIKIDQQTSKDTILQNYLNTIFFGRGSYGVETAARAYFGVDVWTLADDPAKAAYLAALVQSPYYYSTADHDPAAQQALRQRWSYVLDGMVSQHWLSQTVRKTLTFPTTIAGGTNDLAGSNGYLVNAATAYLDQAHQQDPGVPDSTMISRGGYTVVTTFRKDLLDSANTAVRQDLASLNPQGNAADANVHVGLAALDGSTGAVLGFYGGDDYVKRGYNDATQAAGPTGSAIGTALASGVDANPKSNWPSAIADLGKLGIKDVNPKDLPPSDDDITSTPLDAAVAYQAVLNHGIVYQPYDVSEVLYHGAVVWRATPTAQGFANSGGLNGHALITSGVDGSLQWAWTVGGMGRLTIAVDMYATKPNGTTNRTLTGMSPLYPGGKPTEDTRPTAEMRTGNIWFDYFRAAARSTPDLVKADDETTTSMAPFLAGPAPQETTQNQRTAAEPPVRKQTSPPTQHQAIQNTSAAPAPTTDATTTTDPPVPPAKRSFTKPTQPTPATG
jgi:membrane peptidoglycan carboxypeptidase